MSEKYLVVTDSGERPIKLVGPIEESQIGSIIIDMANEELRDVESDWVLTVYDEMQIEVRGCYEFEFGGGIYSIRPEVLSEVY